MHTVVAFAKPFRMPDFFLISGLFLAQVIDRDWRTYLDRKVVHFVYFYLLWTALQFAFKAPLFAQENGVAGTAWLYVESFWEPFGTLWFIYLLPIFFVVTKLARGLRDPARAGVARGRRARERADRYRLDRHRRVRGPLRVLLHRLSVRPARLRAGGGRAGAAGDRRRGPHGLGPDQRGPGLQRALRAAGGLARPRAHRRHGGGHGLGPDGEVRPVPAAALLRAQLDRHLSRLLPADGAVAHLAPQDRLDRRHRGGLAGGDRDRGARRARSCSGRCATPSCASCSSGRDRFWIAPKKARAPALALQPAE